MNTFKAIAYILALSLIWLCFPIQAISDPPQQNNAITSLYNNGKTKYLWLDKQQLTYQAHDALDFIVAASNHGLRPDDYHFSTLRQLNPSQDSLTAQQFDVLLTDGLLKLIHDITVGRLDLKAADPDWFIPPAKFDAIDFLQQALLSDHLKTQLNSLLLTTTEYYKLTEAVSRYQSYVDRGGWPEIPATPLLYPEDINQNIPAIRARLAFEDKDLTLIHTVHSTYYDPLLEQAVRRFQKKHGLKIDGIIGSKTRHTMDVSAEERLQQIKINLERRRWLPHDLGQRYILVNIANYQLSAIENGNKNLDMRVIVGRKSRPTPSFVSKITHLVFNPYWNVPRKLARLDLLPAQQADLNYFYLHNIRVFTTENDQKVEHDPYTIDWQSVTRNNFPYTLRQDPGKHNALGRLKFMSPNRWDIYLHDTPHKTLFDEAQRDFSSGCIRLEDPFTLANFSLAQNIAQQTILNMNESNENQSFKLAEPLPIYAVYFTVFVEDSEVKFVPDVYHRDKRMVELL